jgi:Icc protein
VHRRLYSLYALAAALAGCVELSPFETDLDAHERDSNRKNIARIARLPAPNHPFRFAVLSDSHQYYSELRDIVRQLNRRDDLAFVTHLGDMSVFGLRQEYRFTLEILQDLDVPFVAVIGNHDTLSNGKRLYREMFGDYDFTFVYGHTRFVAVNANHLEFPGEAPDLEWLDAATTPSEEIHGVITLAHSATDEIREVLIENDVRALLRGHEHKLQLDLDAVLPTVQVGDAGQAEWASETSRACPSLAVGDDDNARGA